MQVGKDPCSEFRYTQRCRARQLRQARRAGAAAGLHAAGARRDAPAVAGGGGVAGELQGRAAGTSTIGGISILKPKELGGDHRVRHEHRRQGVVDAERRPAWLADAAADIPDPLFAGVTLPPAAGRSRPGAGHHDEALVIYGTGRSGGPPPTRKPQLYAVDKATGKQVGAVTIPVADERRADDVPAQGPAVHRLRDRSGREHVARGAGAAAFAKASARQGPFAR